MKTYARITALLLSVMMLITLFAACGKDDGADTTASGTESTGDFLSTDDISFLDSDGESVYRVVRPESAEGVVTQAASVVFNGIKSKLSAIPKNTTDEDSADGFAEILIGSTNRPASSLAYDYLVANGTGRINEFIICASGDDIVIQGITDEATKAGAEYFVENYISSSVITGGINYIYSVTEGYTDVALFGKTNHYGVKIVRPIYNVSYLTQVETDKFIDYIIEKTGYKIDILHDQVASTTGNNLDGSGTLTVTAPAEYEIIIGNAKRDGVDLSLDYDEYEVRIEEKKIYLNGGSPHATALAVSEFMKLVDANTVTADKSVLGGDYSATIEGYSTADTYRLTWSDQFEGSVINEDIWDVRWDELCYGGENGGKKVVRGSSALKNNYVSDGFLYINATQTSDAYYGGMLDTEKEMEYLYGYLETSNLHPRGDGFWTALWTASDHVGGALPDPQRMYISETDIDECYGAGTWAYSNTFAWPTSYGKQAMGIPAEETGAIHVNNSVYSNDDRGFWMDFHTYGYVWESNNHITFTCDGYVTYEQDLREGGEQLAYSQPVFIRLSMACGAEHRPATTDMDCWENTNKFIVDWVNLYQKDNGRIFDYNKDSYAWIER